MVVMRVTVSLPCNVVLVAVGWIANAIGQNSWVPLDGYFDPYFEGIHTQVHDMISPMVGALIRGSSMNGDICKSASSIHYRLQCVI